MRFVYIDSHGKEIPIPTVDALALRIELGAITEATNFYDAAADRWAPAGEHEIYRSLQRELENKSGGFIAPPPPSPPRAENPFEALEGPSAAAPPAPQVPKAPAGPHPTEDALAGLNFGLTLEAPAAAEPSAAADRADADPFGMGLDSGLTLGDAMMAPEPEPEAPAPAAKAKEESAAFDFQGFGGMLTDDDEDEEEQPSAPAPAAPAAGGHGMTLEGTLESSYDLSAQGQGPNVVGHKMEMEQPLADLPTDQGGWTPKERLTVDAADEAAAEPAEERARREEARASERPPRARPAAPSEPESKSSGIPALLVVVVLLVVVGGGGWFGWTKFRARQAAQATAETEVVDPPVTIPDIAAELEPRMSALADSAEVDLVAALRTTIPAEKALPVEPDRQWLSGRYLGDASQFASIGEYWSALGGYLEDMQAREEELFASFYQTRLDSAGVTGPDAEAMLARARAGFEAARPDRRPIYRQLQNVIEAAGGLHEFLLANEDRIEYTPAAGAASDPVLEAVPATPELGTEMWDQVDDITESLDALGALDRVTTDRLLEHFLAKLQAIPIR